MFNIDLNVGKLSEEFFIEIFISFAVGLSVYTYVFNKEWELPTLIGIFFFLMLRCVVWMFKKIDYSKRNNLYNDLKHKQFEKYDIEIREAAKIFLHNCTEIAVSLYNHPKHPGEYENERYVSFGEQPGFHYAIEVSRLSMDSFNSKYNFLFCDNELDALQGGVRHIVFHPVFYELVKNYVEKGIISY